MPGPTPKRAFERRRRNRTGDVDTVTAIGPVPVPRVPRDWDPLAKQLFRSLQKSAHVVYFEESDWAAALLAGANTSLALTCPGSGMSFSRKRHLAANVCPRCRRPVTTSGGQQALDRHRPPGIPAEKLAVIWKMWNDLGITESARRKARIEIDRKLTGSEPPKVTVMSEYQDRLGKLGAVLRDDEGRSTDDDIDPGDDEDEEGCPDGDTC